MSWEIWFYYARPAIELIVLVWAFVVTVRGYRVMKRMKDIIDDRERQIEDLKKRISQ